ncbi:hypothetical protein ACFYU5_35735 [Nocardia aobensis]|uniref:Uncharacterized protein n=1 Tax=Nocardia aobensis TaxID=257277 RepID=A0ABW6PFC8_9NOCA
MNLGVQTRMCLDHGSEPALCGNGQLFDVGVFRGLVDASGDVIDAFDPARFGQQQAEDDGRVIRDGGQRLESAGPVVVVPEQEAGVSLCPAEQRVGQVLVSAAGQRPCRTDRGMPASSAVVTISETEHQGTGQGDFHRPPGSSARSGTALTY